MITTSGDDMAAWLADGGPVAPLVGSVIFLGLIGVMIRFAKFTYSRWT